MDLGLGFGLVKNKSIADTYLSTEDGNKVCPNLKYIVMNAKNKYNFFKNLKAALTKPLAAVGFFAESYLSE